MLCNQQHGISDLVAVDAHGTSLDEATCIELRPCKSRFNDELR